VIDAPYLPDAVTMNNAHSTHYTNAVDPRIEHVLPGWSDDGAMARYDVTVDDMRITNVPTNVRDYGGTRYNGNSIFVFEAAGLCVAHLGHLHHTLDDEHLAALGMIDVVLAPVDGTYTMSHDVLLAVLDQIDPAVVVPMHYFGSSILGRFLALVRPTREIVTADGPTVTLARLTLPANAVIVLPGF
jgi:L-ascorbate metabolism protein UlaG (beta-lactamase superfamily)